MKIKDTELIYIVKGCLGAGVILFFALNNLMPIVVLLIVLAIAVIWQLINLNINVLQIAKSKEINQVEIKEDKDWEFIKGLY